VASSDEAVDTWLCEHGSAPVRYRTLRDILHRPADDPELAAAARAVAEYQPALDVAAAQDRDGTWAGRLHTADSRLGIHLTTEIQLPRLSEYGWGPESAAVRRTAVFLRRLLPRQGSASADYRDLAPYMRGTRRRRYIVNFARAIAAGLLAHAGYSDDPAVIATARDLLDATYRFVTGPAAAAPVRGDPPVVVEAAFDHQLGYPAIPDLYLLQLFAYCPALSQGDGRQRIKAVVDYVLGPAYDALDERIGYVALEDHPFVKGWKIVLPPPHELTRTGRWGYGLIVLEMFARLTPLVRHKRLAAYLDWLQQWRRPDGLYDAPAAAFSAAASGHVATRVRLSPDWRRAEHRIADITFRVRLIEALAANDPGLRYLNTDLYRQAAGRASS